MVERKEEQRYNLTPVRFMALEKITGEGDEGEVRSLNCSSEFCSQFLLKNKLSALPAVFDSSKCVDILRFLQVSFACCSLFC